MKTILVIEDEQSVRESILDLLEAEGFRSIGGENGDVGIQLARECHPDLILCDIQMPELDGYGVLTHLRQSAETSSIPFIFLSARTTKLDIRQGMELGADDYLTKPCTAVELLGAISGRLAKHQALLQRYGNPTQARTAVQAVQPHSEFVPSADTPPSSGTRDGLLNHFYQELRNPLSSINMTLYLLKTEPSQDGALTTVQQEYGRELAILQEVYKLQDVLMPESAALLRGCHLIDSGN
ncbi:response regulator transcription factor [Myxacorys almedinensis]|uniref:Response regulator n=1 Tax=Myxacorys almedinensis A TaxID=2690445 RepID=A0A8J7ZCU4_9CYAN|nr:response regulator [Myxacorys almedinensis]NDJ19665.1 response regulator [Myxacorys almedinensis A]